MAIALSLSPTQLGMLFHRQHSPAADVDLEQIHGVLPGALDGDRLRAAFAAAVARHPALRSSFRWHDVDEPQQLVHDAAVVVVDVVDLPDRGDAEADREVAAAMAADRQRPLELDRAPVMRVQLRRHGARRSDLIWTFPHLLLDGRSFAVVLGDVFTALARGAAALPPPPPSFERQLAAIAAQGAGARAFWQQRLAGVDAPTPVPYADPAAADAGAAGARRQGRCEARLSAATTRALRAAAAAAGGSLNTMVQAALALLLARGSGRDDVVFGVARACRHAFPGAGDVAGVFLNMVPARVRCPDDVQVGDWLRTLRADDLAVRPFELVPLVEIQRGAVAPGASLFDAILVYDHASLDAQMRALGVCPPGSRFTLHERTGYPLTLYAYGEDELWLDLHHEEPVLGADGARACLSHLLHLLEALAADPGRRLGDLDLIDAATDARLAAWNATAVPAPATLVPHDVLAAAARTPDAPALTYRTQTLRYGELVARARAVAARLQQLGCGPDDVVGLYVDRTPDLVVAALGIQLAGAAYLPLDPDYPRDRTEFVAGDAALRALVTQRHLEPPRPAGVPVVVLEDVAADGAAPAPVALRAEHLAYVMYTSGSTGRPKGVLVEHRNLANFCLGMDQRLPAAGGKVWLAVTSMSFDISVLELLWTLRTGMHVVLHEDQAKAAQRRAKLPAPAAVPAAPLQGVQFSLMYFADAAAFADGDKYRLLLDGARFADQHGFAAVWTPERHFHDFGGLYPNPSLTAAVLSQITSRVSLRAGSVVLPLHHPARVAEEWAFVDNLSNGRAAVAFASGWHERDFVLNPDAHAEARQRMLDGIEQVRALWRGEAVEFQGPKGRKHAVRTLPRPLQRELPTWLTAAGNPETFRTAGRIGANVLTHLLGQTIDDIRDKVAIYRQAWQEAGHPGRGHVTMMLHTFLAEDDATARRLVEGPMKAYLRTAMGLVRNFASNWTAFKRGKDGRIVDAGIDLDQVTAEEQEDLLDFAFARYYETSTLFGTVDRGESMVRTLVDAGADEIACLIDFGVPADVALRHLGHIDALRQRFVRERAPAAAPAPAPAPAAASVGAPVDDSVAAQIERFAVTHMQCTPSLAAVLIQDAAAARALGRLECLLVGGENLTPALAADLRRTGLRRLCNMYGPTETTVWSAMHDVGDEQGSVPIGRPIANTQVYVADAAGRRLPPGLAGELWIGGAGVVRGYHARPELTAERFQHRPSFGQDSGRCYRTGDLVRQRADGLLEFVGRVDQQVKLRGHRIELGEIENVLGEHPAVRSAAVVLRHDGGDARLVAYVVGRDGEVAAAELREFLRARLPEVMVPAVFVAMAALPETPNKKIDRKALPAPAAAAAVAPSAAAVASSDLERALAQVWRDVLRIGEFSLDDNFFDLGGHSLLAVQVHRRLEAIAPGRTTILDLFRYPSVRQLAAHLGAAAAAGGAAPAGGAAQSALQRAQLRRRAMQGREPAERTQGQG